MKLHLKGVRVYTPPFLTDFAHAMSVIHPCLAWSFLTAVLYPTAALSIPEQLFLRTRV